MTVTARTSRPRFRSRSRPSVASAAAGSHRRGLGRRASIAASGEVMGEMSGLLAAGVLGPGRPTRYGLAGGPEVLAELEARATVGKLALLP